MKRKLESILLVDDDEATNFINKMVIESTGLHVKVNVCTNGKEAIDFVLKKTNNEHKNIPDIIFLDINMPYMNGWEFLEEYKKLDAKFKACIIVAMLTTSPNPDDEEKAKKYDELSNFLQKPLSKKTLLNIIAINFPEEAVAVQS